MPDESDERRPIESAGRGLGGHPAQVSALVILLPNDRGVETAWQRYRALCVQLAAAPALEDDPTFMARLYAARAEWSDTYNAWARRACAA